LDDVGLAGRGQGLSSDKNDAGGDQPGYCKENSSKGELSLSRPTPEIRVRTRFCRLGGPDLIAGFRYRDQSPLLRLREIVSGLPFGVSQNAIRFIYFVKPGRVRVSGRIRIWMKSFNRRSKRGLYLLSARGQGNT
jgi:hypothetical protein